MRQSTIQAYMDAEKALRLKTIAPLLRRTMAGFNYVLQQATMSYLDHLERTSPASREQAKEELNKFIAWVMSKQKE